MFSFLGIIFLLLALCVLLGIMRAPLSIWSLSLGGLLFVLQAGLLSTSQHFPLNDIGSLLLWLPILILSLFNVPHFRRIFLIQPAFTYVKKVLPTVSDTEQQVLDSGTVGFDTEIFSGNPDWNKLRSVATHSLTAEEVQFLNGPTEQLCSLIDDWEIRHKHREIPERIWQFVKDNGFLGMLISKEHGGCGFSAQAQSLILGKIASRSPDVVTIVMVPNSLGPGELIEKYGTRDQKEYYLPRLARGEEIPCFSLTGPTSGSDAAAMLDVGYITNGMHQGKEMLGIRLTWDKRYITLGPKATLIGLAFRLFDPENLLGKGEDIGISLALIPADHKGVQIGRRHLPSGAAFPNGPNSGRDVFIPIHWAIGGDKLLGQGWRMLIECLAAGRAISLPSSATAGSKMMLRVTSAYARIRKQFGIPIGLMEGVDEALARMVEVAYVNEAARSVTAGMVSRGEHPSVLSALMKYNTTERLRQSVNDAMDIHGGRGICDGPKNYLRSAYEMVPIGITVEGANILTRALITFAQGALRSHPYLYKEIKAVKNPNPIKGMEEFETEFLTHLSHVISNISGSFFHNLTFGYFAPSPRDAGNLRKFYKQLYRSAKNFALVSDYIISTMGAKLKVKQKLSGRLADALSEIYMSACVLKRYEDDGCPAEDYPILQMTLSNCLSRFENALQSTLRNLTSRFARFLLRVLIYPLGQHYYKASDRLETSVSHLILKPNSVRDRLTRHIYIPNDEKDPIKLLEIALEKVLLSEDAEKKLNRAVRQGTIRRLHGIDYIEEAFTKGIISKDEASLLKEVEALVSQVIAVDHFDPHELRHSSIIKDSGTETGHPGYVAAE